MKLLLLFYKGSFSSWTPQTVMQYRVNWILVLVWHSIYLIVSFLVLFEALEGSVNLSNISMQWMSQQDNWNMETDSPESNIFLLTSDEEALLGHLNSDFVLV